MQLFKIKSYDFVYFLALAMIIVLFTSYVIFHNYQMVKIVDFEKKSVIYLDRNLCERIRFLESISKEFILTGKKSEECDAVHKLNIERILHD